MSTLIEPALPESTRAPSPAARRVHPQQPSAGPHAIPTALESAAVSVHLSQDDRPHDCTLLEVMMAVSEVTDDDEEVLATVSHMLKSGRVRLSEGTEYGQADPAA